MKKSAIQTIAGKVTFAQIKKKYPDKWVGLADAEFQQDGFTVKKATVLCAGKDKRKAQKKLCELMDTTSYERYRLEWTGTALERNVDYLIV